MSKFGVPNQRFSTCFGLVKLTKNGENGAFGRYFLGPNRLHIFIVSKIIG